MTVVVCFIVPIKFWIFHYNFKKFCELMKHLERKIKNSSMNQAKANEKVFEIIAFVTIAIFVLEYGAEVVNHFLTLNGNRLIEDIFYYLLKIFSYIANDFVNLLIQFCFFNCCVHVKSVLEQIENDLQNLKYVRDEIRLSKEIQDLVEVHIEVLDLISHLFSLFKSVISLNFVTNILLIGQFMAYSLSSWIVFAQGIPFMLFDAWIYCYSLQIIQTKVKFKFSERVNFDFDFLTGRRNGKQRICTRVVSV